VEACAVVAVAFRTFARIFASGKPISLEEISLWPSTSSAKPCAAKIASFSVGGSKHRTRRVLDGLSL